jgi:hypothetical protein
MKRLFFALIAVVIMATSAIAQQDPHYSHFMFNQAGYNPAFCGTEGMINAVLVYRNQWMGMEGAPKTANLCVDAPVRVFGTQGGVGATITSDNIGFEKNFNAKFAYAHHIQAGSGVLSIGVDAGLFNKNIDTIVKYPCGKEGDTYIIPDTVTQLADWSFAGCVNLKSIIIPDSVEVIGDGAFCGCENLTSIVIPSSVKSFGDRCFLSCDSLTSATVPKGFPRNCRPKNKLIERPFPRWCEVKEV